MTASMVSAVPRDFFCEHASSKSRVLVLLAHPEGPPCAQAVFTCRDAHLAQHLSLIHISDPRDPKTSRMPSSA